LQKQAGLFSETEKTECVDTVSNCRSNSKGERWNEDLCRGVGIDDESNQVP